MKSSHRIFAALFYLLILSLTLSAHHSWIIPTTSEKYLEIGHGHHFPVSEQALSATKIRVTLLSVDGKSIFLNPSKETGHLSVPFPEAFTGLSAAFFIEEPVILTRTTKGVRTAPMNTLTGVVDSFRRHRSGVYLTKPGQKIPAAGQHVLLTCHRDEGRLILIVRMGPKPMPDADIEVCEPGRNEERKIGETDGKGQLTYNIQSTGMHLFSAHLIQETASVETKRNEYTATLAVQLE